jgi:hypothetical protein
MSFESVQWQLGCLKARESSPPRYANIPDRGDVASLLALCHGRELGDQCSSVANVTA